MRGGRQILECSRDSMSVDAADPVFGIVLRANQQIVGIVNSNLQPIKTFGISIK